MEKSTSFWGGRDFCWACRVLAADAPVCVLADAAVAVLLNPFPVNPGHTLIVPRQHLENLYELPDVLAGPILSMAGRVAVAARKAFAADGMTLRQNNGAASDQHLFHFHLHVIPRFEGDGERFSTWATSTMTLADQERVRQRLRGTLT